VVGSAVFRRNSGLAAACLHFGRRCSIFHGPGSTPGIAPTSRVFAEAESGDGGPGVAPMREDDLRQRAPEMFRDWFPRFTPLTPSSPGWLNPRQRGCQWGMGFSCGLRGHNLARRLLPGAKCRHARLPQQPTQPVTTPFLCDLSWLLTAIFRLIRLVLSSGAAYPQLEGRPPSAPPDFTWALRKRAGEGERDHT